MINKKSLHLIEDTKVIENMRAVNMIEKSLTLATNMIRKKVEVIQNLNIIDLIIV
jgi:hypothetical protein